MAERNEDERGGTTRTGGHMGAGRSGKEGLGSEKPADELGSNEPEAEVAHRMERREKEPNRHDQGN